MKIGRSIGKADKTLFLYLILWFIGNLLFLGDFPFFHTDESWLSNLSRSMMEQGSLSATEDVFDLFPRHPHGVKILYHLLQIFLFSLGEYSLFTARLLSLMAGFGSLLLFYNLLLSQRDSETTFGKWPALAVTILFSWDIQFVYASHMARQEIFLIFMMLATLRVYNELKGCTGIELFILLGIITGLAIGFHPNAFITAWPVGLLLVRDLLKRKLQVRQGLSYLGAAAFSASLFLIISLIFNIHFLHDYREFGETVGVGDTLDIKLLNFPRFHEKLFTRLGGTYYLPDIRYIYFLTPLILIITLVKRIPRSDRIWAGFLGISIGLILLGKYSQPSVIFYFPFFYWGLYLCTVHLFPRQKSWLILLPAYAILLFLSSFQLIKERGREKGLYQTYISHIAESVPENAIALGGLNLEYYLDEGQLYDWRNLAYLRDKNLTPAQYIEDRDIEYVIITSELSYLYETRPVWNVLYGNTSFWYPELMAYLNEEAQLISRFPSPGYGTRIAAYRLQVEEETFIYGIPRDVSTRE